jgi:hypothetical protein
VVACTLISLNINLNEVRGQVGSILGYRKDVTGGQAPFTPTLESCQLPSQWKTAWKETTGFSGTSISML